MDTLLCGWAFTVRKGRSSVKNARIKNSKLGSYHIIGRKFTKFLKNPIKDLE